MYGGTSLLKREVGLQNSSTTQSQEKERMNRSMHQVATSLPTSAVALSPGEGNRECAVTD